MFYREGGKRGAADEFFARLVSEHSADAPRPFDPERALHYLGRLGQAMVLAFRDDVDSSQREFRALLPSDKPDRLDTMLQKHPRFAELLALALERNRQSLGVKELTEPRGKYRKTKR